MEKKSVNIKFFELAFKKVAADKDFIAYSLDSYIKIEGLSHDILISLLGCTQENYLKLALCKAPNIQYSDYYDRINRIAEYSNVSLLELNKILKTVTISANFSQQKQDNYSLAARDRNPVEDISRKDSQNNHENKSD